MFGSTIIDVAIGLMFLYLILSLSASAINEFIASILATRATTLEIFIRQLFVAPQIAKFRTRLWWFLIGILQRLPGYLRDVEVEIYTSLFYHHTLIAGQGSGQRLPSYIKDEDFAQAIFALVLSNSPLTEWDMARQKLKMPPQGSLQNIISELDTAIEAIKKTLEEKSSEAAQTNLERLQAILNDHAKTSAKSTSLETLRSTTTSLITWVVNRLQVLTGTKPRGSSAQASLSDALKNGSTALTIRMIGHLRQIISRLPPDKLPDSEKRQLLDALTTAQTASTDFFARVLEIFLAQDVANLDQKSDLANFLASIIALWRKAINQLPVDSPLRNLMTSALLQSPRNLPDILEHIQDWYNNAQQRVSGWYKRKVQYFLLTIGMAMAVFLNIDTIAITNKLLQSQSLRDSIVNQAKTYLSTPPAPGLALTASAIAPVYLTPTAAASITPAAGPSPTAAAFATPTATFAANGSVAPQDYVAQFASLKGQFDQLNIPLGWPDPDAPQSNDFWFLLVHNRDYLFKKIIGILITALAVAQGAPFWFDLLNKVVNLRGSGKEPSQEKEKTDEPNVGWLDVFGKLLEQKTSPPNSQGNDKPGDQNPPAVG